METSVLTSTEEETEAFATAFAETIKVPTVIALHGNLGAGKTVFSRGFARGLGVAEPISSPTFTIIQEYPLSEGKWLFHLDLYRIQDSNAALAFGVDEYIEDPNGVMLVEWSERIPELLPEGTIHVYIIHKGENQRAITVTDTIDTELLELE